MPRARTIFGVDTANFARSKYASLTWQKVQSLPIELANMPIASKNVSTGIPFSTCTLLKTSSDMTGACGLFCPCAAAPARQSAAAIATAAGNTRMRSACRRRWKRGVVGTEEEVAAIGERYLLAVRPGAAVLRPVAFDDDFEPGGEIAGAQAATEQRRRTARLDGPVFDLAIGRLDVHVDPAVRIDPRHLRQAAFQADRLVDVELRRERMVGRRGQRETENRRSENRDERRGLHSHQPPDSGENASVEPRQRSVNAALLSFRFSASERHSHGKFCLLPGLRCLQLTERLGERVGLE